ncbi:MAG: hypothetical protein L0H63_00140, partial [Nitrococcus sp.]|nr:hypothetical protein [Nitrococcus sp.]
MTPQSTFMVLAPLADGQEAGLRAVLASMNLRPGVVDPENSLVPFGQFERLHFARFVILDAPTAREVIVYGLPPRQWPTSLVFIGDCDGPAETFLTDLDRRADAGLRRIFGFCRGFSDQVDLLDWMRRHECPPAANYVNWIGRTVVQIHEERALRAALVEHLQHDAGKPGAEPPTAVRERLVRFVHAERQAGRLHLSPAEPTPADWRIRNLLHAVGVPLALLVLAPFLVLAAPLLIYQLRSREKTDPEITPEPDQDHMHRLTELEDHDVTNQFTVFGEIKPGRFRRRTIMFLLWLLDYSARHIYTRGYLTRV